MDIFLQGLALQASLILALGAQNIFVLNSGLRKQRHLLVALICSICDTLLIFLGVLGIATIFIQVPVFKIALGLVGVGFLFFYGVMKLKEAKRGSNIALESGQPTSLKKVILTTLGFSLLNPNVYLDTVVLIGGYSSKFSQMSDRFNFGLGASAFSILWFYGLSLFAAMGSRLLNHPRAMRIIALLSATILLTLSFKLGSDVWGWMKEY